MTQLAELKKHLRRNRKGITQMEAYENLGIMRLSQRVIELEDEGWLINRQWVTVPSRHGETRVVRYRMIKGA